MARQPGEIAIEHAETGEVFYGPPGTAVPAGYRLIEERTPPKPEPSEPARITPDDLLRNIGLRGDVSNPITAMPPATPGGQGPLAREAPSMIGGAIGTRVGGIPGGMLGSGLGELTAQVASGEPLNPMQLGLATLTGGVAPGTVRSGAMVERAGEAALRRSGVLPNLYEKAMAAGGEQVIPLRHLSEAVGAMSGDVSAKPASAGFRKIRRMLDSMNTSMPATLEGVNQLRREIGQLIQEKAPNEARRLYGALMSDLRVAAGSGVPGASELIRALTNDGVLNAMAPEGFLQKLLYYGAAGATPFAGPAPLLAPGVMAAGKALRQTPPNPLLESLGTAAAQYGREQLEP